ncbi:microfibril-associated glycoprotein 4-like [Mercenaria mercenaria]|uniref:microfibril-associated glycoprotein 4-like n=1 Tax=Mercenaria mercenaria TaxID=6596 RepID=UPI00234E7BDF|nr:microfibril-associated glycoprotein 4-like [Mercenaria mercenaria]
MVESTVILILVVCIISWIFTNNFYNYFYSKPRDCQDIQSYGHNETGIYTIYPEGALGFPVRCDMDTTSGAWTVIQRRVSASDFYKTWNEYQVGFGDLNENFWLGNQQIHMITKQGWYELRIDLTSPDNEKAFATYQVFYTGDAKTGYELFVDGYKGTAGDSLAIHNGQKFTTKDRDNDIYRSNCAVDSVGAWWYTSCHHSNLNGDYGNTQYAKGPDWYNWKGYYVPMKTTEMKIRRWQSRD